MGEPKATDIPDAAAADRISRFRATEVLSCGITDEYDLGLCLTFVVIDVREELYENVGAAAGHVNQRALLSQPHTRCDSETLRSVS